ncbi:MAG: hypothetical protein IJ794_10890 [Lachnospiraceae bacterium]|nr:hypothetical protein [Lachnospiraceae bacterium]
MRKWLFGLMAAILFGITVLGVAGTVRAQENLEMAEKEQFYKEQERELLDNTTKQMEHMGFFHCGITLNRVVEGEVNRTYTFTIHHKRIDLMEPAEREALADQLRELAETFETASPEDVCKFQYEFLIL